MYPFNYIRATDLLSAEDLLAGDEECILLAGGMTLLPTMKQRLAQPSQLLDLTALDELKGITVTSSAVTIRALTVHADVAESEEIRSRLPALASLAGNIGDPQVRNRGTIGGSVANADPAADYPAALLALDATVVTNHRSLPAEQFFIDMFETALEGNEIVKSVSFRIPDRAAYSKFPNPASRYAIAGVFMADFGGEYRVAVTGVAGCVFRYTAVEEALQNALTLESLQQALSENPLDEDELNDDIHASAAYRAHLTAVLAKRALQQLDESLAS